MICCYLTFLVTTLPTCLSRILVWKERVHRDFFSHQNRNRAIHDIAKARPVPAVMLFTGMCALEVKIFVLKFDSNTVLCVVALRFLFVILNAILAQPKRKSLSVIEPGRTKDAIKELAAASNFPPKNVYVVENRIDKVLMSLAYGLPRRRYIPISKTMIEEGNLDGIVGFTAHAMGSWKHSNRLRALCVGQLYFIMT